ncbi:DUF5683 domain-containing protein [Bacteroidota bacterium]
MTLKHLYRLVLIFAYILVFGINSFTQTDSENLDIKTDTISSTQLRKEANQAINKALKTSLLPGLSPIKNKKYWKIPIYYSGYTALTITAINNNNKLKNAEELYLNTYSNYLPYSYNAINTENENLLEYLDQRNKYKFYRNASIAGIGLLYMINLADGIKPEYEHYHCPLKAGLYSAFLPGLGQIYNQEYWKLPLVYIGIGVFAYFINYNHVEYLKYLQAYLISEDQIEKEFAIDYFDNNYNGKYHSPENQKKIDKWNLRKDEVFKLETFYWVKYVEERYNGDNDFLLEYKDRWKRNRDLNIIGISAFYLVNIIDASVFAHLSDYDVTDDLVIKIKPKLSTFSANYLEYGILFTMNF